MRLELHGRPLLAASLAGIADSLTLSLLHSSSSASTPRRELRISRLARCATVTDSPSRRPRSQLQAQGRLDRQGRQGRRRRRRQEDQLKERAPLLSLGAPAAAHHPPSSSSPRNRIHPLSFLAPSISGLMSAHLIYWIPRHRRMPSSPPSSFVFLASPSLALSLPPPLSRVRSPGCSSLYICNKALYSRKWTSSKTESEREERALLLHARARGRQGTRLRPVLLRARWLGAVSKRPFTGAQLERGGASSSMPTPRSCSSSLERHVQKARPSCSCSSL